LEERFLCLLFSVAAGFGSWSRLVCFLGGGKIRHKILLYRDILDRRGGDRGVIFAVEPLGPEEHVCML